MMGATASTPSTNLQGNHTLNIPPTSSSSGPTPNPVPISIAIDIASVDKLELESYARRVKELERAVQAEERRVNRQLDVDELTKVKRRIDAIEAAQRVQAQTIIITHTSGRTEPVSLSTLSHSYRRVRNLLWIEQHPVYKKALADWEVEENLFASRVARKQQRRRGFQNDVYQMIGLCSVFQGVLLTASSQSTYLRCRNVGLPIALSAFASFGTLLHIRGKFKASSELLKTINSEDYSKKEVKARIEALKEKGEAFRFYDFQEDRETTLNNIQPMRYRCGFRTQDFVQLAIFLFSVAFVIAHWLILCRPGAA